LTGVYKSEEAAKRVHDQYRDYLSRWPVANEQLSVPTREGKTFVVVSGPKDAPPVILLHGTMAMAAMWMGDVIRWAQHFRVYALDIIGDAGLSAPSRPSMASEVHALWLEDVMQELNVSKASFVGISLGGWLALDFAIRRAERVTGLVLMTPGGIADKNILPWALPLLFLGSWGARKVRERIIGRAPADMTDEARQFLNFSDAIFKGMRPRTQKPLTVTDKQLASLTMPLLVLLGEKDVTMDSQVIKYRVEKNIPDAEVMTVPEARHYLGDQSEPVLSFLQRVTGESSNNPAGE